MAQNNNSGVENGIKQWQLQSEHQWTGQQYIDNSPKEKYRPVRHRRTSRPVVEPNHFMARPSHERPVPIRIGGPGMQAIFLGSNRACGTGVFLPRIQGNNAQNKPAYPPVLLPYRVVQTLKLNVNEVGKKMQPQTDDQPKTSAKRNENRRRNKKQDVEYICPDVYLPKEWTY